MDPRFWCFVASTTMYLKNGKAYNKLKKRSRSLRDKYARNGKFTRWVDCIINQTPNRGNGPLNRTGSVTPTPHDDPRDYQVSPAPCHREGSPAQVDLQHPGLPERPPADHNPSWHPGSPLTDQNPKTYTESPPADQDPLGHPKSSPADQDPLSTIESPLADQDPLGNPESPPTDEDPQGQPDCTPADQDTLGHLECQPVEEDSLGHPESPSTDQDPSWYPQSPSPDQDTPGRSDSPTVYRNPPTSIDLDSQLALKDPVLKSDPESLSIRRSPTASDQSGHLHMRSKQPDSTDRTCEPECTNLLFSQSGNGL